MSCHIWTWRIWTVFLICYYFIVPVLDSHVICFKFFISCFTELRTLWDSFCPTLCCCVSHKDKEKRKPDLNCGLQLARANRCTTCTVTDEFVSLAQIHCKLRIKQN